MFTLAEKALAGLSRILPRLLPWKSLSIDAALILRLKWRCGATE
jgi:hypothetical protein